MIGVFKVLGGGLRAWRSTMNHACSDSFVSISHESSLRMTPCRGLHASPGKRGGTSGGDIKLTPRTLDLAKGLVAGERVALARSITLIESSKEEHQIQAQGLLEYVMNHRKIHGAGKAKESFRLGIAGPPGAGKSTFIEALGTMLVREKGLKVAVLAIDPSSSRTGGSILGDKTRMEFLTREKNAFVRPTPARGVLGGVAQHTNEVCLLCEAMYDIIIVESVGLGQSEVVIDDTVDMLLLLVPPAGGDELQGVKKGIMEVCDMVVVNKADGELEAASRHAATGFMNSLQLMRRKRPEWRPRVKRCSALRKKGIEEVWNIVEKFRVKMTKTGDIATRRLEQNRSWMWNQFQEQLKLKARQDPELESYAKELESDLAKGLGTPRQAARSLVHEFLKRSTF